jgi:hypothetical protein
MDVSARVVRVTFTGTGQERHRRQTLARQKAVHLASCPKVVHGSSCSNAAIRHTQRVVHHQEMADQAPPRQLGRQPPFQVGPDPRQTDRNYRHQPRGGCPSKNTNIAADCRGMATEWAAAHRSARSIDLLQPRVRVRQRKAARFRVRPSTRVRLGL